MEFPGGRVPFTHTLRFVGGQTGAREPMPCYRVLDSAGMAVEGAEVPHPLDRDTAVKVYTTMVSLQTVDTIFYEAQRQVRGGTISAKQITAAHGLKTAPAWPAGRCTAVSHM